MNSVQISTLFVIIASIFTLKLVSAHSQMRCAKYDVATGRCNAPIRNQGVSFLQEAYSFQNNAPISQSAWTNPITSSYANGAGCPDWAPCPDSMGTFSTGETFTVMWFARNHAVDNQNPGLVSLYLSPLESANQGGDVTQAVMETNKICQGPFMNCGGANSDMTPCTLTCTMPTSLQNGIYTLWWKWNWQNGAMYATSADINVVAGSNPAPVTPATTGRLQSVTTGRLTTGLITTGKPQVTTGRTQPSLVTTGKPQVTTGQSQPTLVTTGKSQVTTGQTQPPSVTTSQIVSLTTGALGSFNCAGATKPSISQAVMVSVDLWGAGSSAQFRSVIEVQIQEQVLSNWYLQFVFPPAQSQPHLTLAVNGGFIYCEDASPVYHAMIKPNPWVSTVTSGTVITIEVFGTNKANLSKSNIISNTVLNVMTM